MDDLNATINGIFQGCIDIHVHASPDAGAARRFDIVDLATNARDAGMRAFVFKSHEYPTLPPSYVVNRLVPGIEVYGSLVLNDPVGGLNPHAVEVAAKIGAKKVWMPTFSAHHWATTRLGRVSGIRVIDADNKLLPSVHDILDIIQQHGLALGTGHLSVEEQDVLTVETRRRQIRTCITHADLLIPVEWQKEFARRGAFLEHAFVQCVSAGTPVAAQMPIVSVGEMAEVVKATTPAVNILSTDLGQAFNPAPPEGMRMFVARLLGEGIPPGDIERMVKNNPAALLAV